VNQTYRRFHEDAAEGSGAGTHPCRPVEESVFWDKFQMSQYMQMYVKATRMGHGTVMGGHGSRVGRGAAVPQGRPALHSYKVMSDPTNSERHYELVDVDVSMVSVGDVASDETTNVVTANHAEHPPPTPTLPTGEVIDGKNTLQSFAAPSTQGAMPPTVASGDPVPPFTLPGGAVITGKNTLQSFPTDGPPNHQRINVDARMDVPDDDDAKPSPEDAPPPNPAAARAPLPTTVVAVAVETDIVYAELALEEPNGNQNGPVTPVTSWYQSRWTFALMTLLIMVLLAIVLGVSIYFSSNGSSSNAASNNGNGLPTSAPIAVVPMNVPIASVPTMAPMAINPNITIRAAILTSYINNITLSNQTIAANGTSPESQALSWLIYNDTLLETAAVIRKEDPISKNAMGFRIRQRYPLLVMWFQQTDAAKWDNDAEWLVNPNECYWFGISCKPSYVYYDDDFNGGSENAVTQVIFNLIGSYVGVIPSEIGLLTTLEHFEVQNTLDLNDANGRYLLGSLPDSIGQWTALTYFDVSGNSLNGTLPDSIGQWTALAYLDISINYGLTGTLPNSIGQWTALADFDVNSNALTGTLPASIGQWTALTNFDISYNNGLTGTLPDSIGQWTAMMDFIVSGNALTGTLPASIGQWTALTNFDIRYNQGLNGTLPDSIGQWTALTYFEATGNNLNGTIPSSIGNWSLIETAYFNGNQLVGTMPNAICQYIDPDTDVLQVDCTVNCTCCTADCSF
jgi:hypothetical protein